MRTLANVIAKAIEAHSDAPHPDIPELLAKAVTATAVNGVPPCDTYFPAHQGARSGGGPRCIRGSS